MFKYKLLILIFPYFFLDGLTQTPYVDITQEIGMELSGKSQGIAIGDYNNDGWEDIYISVETGNNRLCQNNGDGTFSEVATELGLNFSDKTKTAVWGDFNNDGWLDLYIANLRTPDQLLLNKGNGQFENITQQAGIDNQNHNPTSVNLADINNDGFLDIYVSNFDAENRLYFNNGDLSFTDYTLASGATDKGSSMGSLFFDYDGDGDQDLYLVHDNIEPNILYKNDGTGHFTDVSTSSRTNVRGYGMGVTVGDVNNDALPDLYITNLYKNYLLINQGDGTFYEKAKPFNVDDFGMGWGTTFLDFNNDGLQDIYVSNDSYFSDFDNVLYENKGDLTFKKVAETTISRQAGYGIACFDYNQNGQTDLVLANYGEVDYTQLFINENTKNEWIGFYLVGTNSNRQAIGTSIILETENGKKYYQTLTAGHGWASQNSTMLHFGLPDNVRIKNIKIYWPSGLIQTITPHLLREYYTVLEGELPIMGIQKETLATTTSTVEFKETVSIGVSPNPNNGEFNLKLEGIDESEVQIDFVDIMGRSIQPIQTINRFPNFGITLSKKSSRLIFACIQTPKKNILKKIIIE